MNNRLIPNAMEPRAAVGEYDGGTGSYTCYSTSQNPHVLRLILCAFVMGVPEHKMRGHRTRCRRRLRLQDLLLCRGSRLHLGREEGVPLIHESRRDCHLEFGTVVANTKNGLNDCIEHGEVPGAHPVCGIACETA